MRRVLIPLDGSHFAEAIVPDALRLAGSDGELILVKDAAWPILQRDIFVDTRKMAIEDSESYLHEEADKLRCKGIKVRTESLVHADAATAIDQAALMFKADLVAIATHGRRPLSRLMHGGVAWRALAHSPVPVLLRHFDEFPQEHPSVANGKRRIMVPLDGSGYAEKALSMAQELAEEWKAVIVLARVIPDFAIPDTPYTRADMLEIASEEPVREAQVYLEDIAHTLSGEVETHAGFGSVADTLERCTQRYSVTDVVMTSHGFTGLSRVILGSVADELIHRLHCPIIVVPVLASGEAANRPLADREIFTVGP